MVASIGTSARSSLSNHTPINNKRQFQIAETAESFRHALCRLVGRCVSVPDLSARLAGLVVVKEDAGGGLETWPEGGRRYVGGDDSTVRRNVDV
jgi:hypothetical protein